jgi:arylsulfatase A-like enzyme
MTFALLLAACTSSQEPNDDDDVFVPPPPRTTPYMNVFMISIDTLRRDHVDRYATDGVERMPFLSSLLADGVALDDHRQCSNWTFHSMSCTTLGRPVEEIGWTARMGSPAQAMPLGLPTLAQRLSDVGFYTAVRSSNGWFSAEWNTTQGYEVVTPPAGGALRGQIAAITAQAVTDLAGEPDRPWFLHVHTTEPHAAYAPPDTYLLDLAGLDPVPWDLGDTEEIYDAFDTFPTLPPEEQELLEQHLTIRYDGELRWVDDQLRDVWPELESGGWLQDTLVVWWTDHGEQFWEHGHSTHAWLLGPEEVEGVLGFWATDITPGAIAAQTHAVDLVPTVLDYLGLPVPDDGTLPGLVASTAPPVRTMFTNTAARAGAITSVLDGGWELQFTFSSGQLALYDVGTDPGRLTNLYAPEHPEVARLWALLQPKAELLAAAAPDLIPLWPTLPTSSL